MKVALRDDDTSYFTAPERLHEVYRDVWDRIPVCLATVPFAVGYPQPGIPDEHWHSGRSFPLDDNVALVDELKRLRAANRVTIALHGYTHQDYPDGYEFQAAPDPERRVNDGLTYLQHRLETKIRIFVPPHNALSKRALAAVSRAGLNLLGSFLSFRPSMRPWEWRTLPNYVRIRRFRAATGRRKHDRFVYPFVLRYERHAEFGCHSLIPGTTFEQVRTAFDEARDAGGDFCLATHYWEIDDALKAVMLQFLSYAARDASVRFVSAEELFV
jgi:predicted deacetylase